MNRQNPGVGPSLLAGLIAMVMTTDGMAQMEEIIVSARKRDENLQDVPISVTAFSTEEIERLNIASLDDITQRTASLILDQGFSPQDTRIVIRGLAPIQGRQNAAVLQDGVDISSQAIATNGGSLLINPRLFDIERVEVVKGPQNALYGRSAFAGAINYITRKPTEEFKSNVGLDFGNNGRTEIRGGLSGPLIGETLLGGVNVAAWNHDGFYKNTVTGNEVGGEEGRAIAGSLVWKATEDLTFNVRAEYTDDEFGVSPYFAIIPNQDLPLPPEAVGTVVSSTLTTIPGVAGTIPDGGTNVGTSVVAGGVVAPTMSDNPRSPGVDYAGTEREISRVTLTADWSLDPFDILYLGHFGNQKSTQNEDGQRVGSVSSPDLTAGAELLFVEDTDLISQELRLQSNNEGAFNWTVGALYWEQDQNFRDGSFNCVANPIFVPFPPPGALQPGQSCGPTIASVNEGINGANRFPDRWNRETKHWSAYFLVDWEFAENFAVVLEGRYTDEELTVSGPNRAPPPGLPPGFPNPFSRILDPRGLFGPTFLQEQNGDEVGSDSDSFFTPKVTLQWTPNDDSLYYFSFAEGRKPSGIAALNGGAGSFIVDDQRFEQERVDVWELGAKTSWLDNRLTLNGAVFFQDYSDKQTNTQVVIGEPPDQTLGTRPVNASSAEVWGLELDAFWLITDNLSFSASYTYLNTEYKDFKIFNGGAAPIALAGNCRVVQVAGDTTCELDYSGNQLEYAPENSFVSSLTYRNSLSSSLDWFVEGDVIFQDERFQDNSNRVKFDAYTVANFRLGLVNERWELIAYVDNAFENDAVKTGFRSIFTPAFSFAGGGPDPFTVVLPSGFQGVMPDLRQWGLRANFRFGG